MGHMNVMWYVSKFDEATWHVFASLGLTPSFLRQHDRGIAVTALTAVHMDLKTRKSCAFPKEFLTRGRQMVVAYDPGM